MAFGDKIQKEIYDKYFDPIINGDDLNTLRAWLKKQPDHEIEIFRNSFNFRDFKDRAAIIDQVLRERKEKAAGRSAWWDRGISFIIGIISAIVAQWLAKKAGL